MPGMNVQPLLAFSKTQQAHHVGREKASLFHSWWIHEFNSRPLLLFTVCWL